MSGNEPYFAGHFGQLVMPGVLIIGALAQVRPAIWLYQPRPLALFAGIDKAVSGARYPGTYCGWKWRRPDAGRLGKGKGLCRQDWWLRRSDLL